MAIAVDLAASEEQFVFTASTVGYCLPHPSPANRGGVIFLGMPIDRNAFFARTMHTPDSPERAALRAALRELSKALLPLHRALIEAARDDYAFAYGKAVSPTQLLQLISDDPFFAWLKPMTSLIVEIDEMARVDFEADDARAVAARVEQLFDVAAFNDRYVPLLQRDVDVAVTHAAIRRALAKLRA